MLRLAYFSPLPPQRTGIADYSADLLLPELTKLAEVTLFVERPFLISSDLTAHCAVELIDNYSSLRWDYDAALYHMGNSLFHHRILGLAYRYPGITVLHDETLHHLIASITDGQGDSAAYARELAYTRGIEGHPEALDAHTGALSLFSRTLNDRLVDLSLGTLTHSHYLRRKLLSSHPQSRIGHVPFPMPAIARRDRDAVRVRFGVPPDAFVIGTYGGITPEKRLDLVADVFLGLRQSRKTVFWVIGGATRSGDESWYDRIAASGDVSDILLTGHVEDMGAFHDAIAMADVCVNLRNPSAGETSLSALRALALGVPVIVSDVGWYRELPDECCVRIQHNATEGLALQEALLNWLNEPQRRRAAGVAGRRYVAEMHNPRRTAEGYIAFVRSILEGL